MNLNDETNLIKMLDDLFVNKIQVKISSKDSKICIIENFNTTTHFRNLLLKILIYKFQVINN